MAKGTKIIKSIVSIFAIILLQFTTYAQDANFGVVPILPKNQNSDASYFDLRLKPVQKQTIEILLSNSENVAADIEVLISYATSNPNGLIVYSETDENKKDETLKNPMTSIATTEKDIVTVPPNGVVIVPIDITMPKEEFEGVVLGGIQVRKLIPEDPEGQGVTISNEFAYVIGLVLSENDKEIESEILLKSADASFSENKVKVLLNVQNPKPKIMKNMNFKAEFFAKGKDQVLYTFENEYFSMAPNSNIGYEVNWESHKIKSGDYVVVLTATKDAEVWQWSEEFTVTKTDVQEFFNYPVEEAVSNGRILMTIIAVLCLLLVLLGIPIIWRIIEKRSDSK